MDIPAKIRRSPAKAAAIAGGAAFLLLKAAAGVRPGPTADRGKAAPLPSRMLPEEIDKSLRRLGSDGDKVRGTLERDFADYVAKAAADRRRVRRIVLLTVAQPILTQLARRGATSLLSPDEGGFQRRLGRSARARAEEPTLDEAPRRATTTAIAPADRTHRTTPAGRRRPSDLAGEATELVGEVGVEPTRRSRGTGS